VEDLLPAAARLLLPLVRQLLLPQQVMVAGDTRNDMVFAEQAKATSVGVLSGVSKERDLASYADYIVPSVEQIPALLDSLEGAK